MFVVIEGIDGTGKQTQTRLLAEKLRMSGMTVDTIAFPQYGKSRGAALVTKYLAGDFGELDAFASAMFYALDRLEAKSALQMKLGSSDVVIADRYVGSNMAHQSARLTDDVKRGDLKRFIMWLEYECHRVPVPDIEFLLRTTREVSEKNRQDRETTDIHESDKDHQTLALEQYEAVARETGWFIVDTTSGGVQRAPEDISKEIYGIVVRERIYKTGMNERANLEGLAATIFGELMQTGSPERLEICKAAARRALQYVQKCAENP